MDHVGLQYSMEQMSASRLCGVQLSRKMTISEIGRYYEVFSVLYFIKNKKNVVTGVILLYLLTKSFPMICLTNDHVIL